MSIKGIIYYSSNWENGIAQLKQIEENYNRMKITTTRSHYMRHGSWIQFENGDVWKVLGAKDSARGYKWNIAYIERSVNLNTYRCIIAPAAIDFPFAATRLWGEGNLHLDFDPPLPF